MERKDETSAGDISGRLADADRVRGDLCYQSLIDFLQQRPFPQCEQLVQELEQKEGDFRRWFSEQASGCKAVERLSSEIRYGRMFGIPLEDPLMIRQAASALRILMQILEKGGEDPVHFMAAHDSAIRTFLEKCSGQVDALCSQLIEIRKLLKSRSDARGRIFLLNLPSGNSLAVQLLQELLTEDGIEAQPIVVALGRNDKKREGVTRMQLLEEKLRDAGLAANDIVLYLDEWNSGVNFNAITELLEKLLPRGASLLTIAMVAHDAATQERWTSFCSSHDKSIARQGVSLSAARKIFPPIPTPLCFEGRFFWSEDDRMAGYRKMQIHGSMFSSFDELLKLLSGDEQALNAAIEIYLAMTTKVSPIRDVARFRGEVRRRFHEGYADYLECRSDLERSSDEEARGGEIEDMAIALQNMLNKWEQQLGRRPACFALKMAGVYQNRLGSLDPANRYYHKVHAPMIAEITGMERRTNEVAKEFLRERLAAMAVGKGADLSVT